jgi:hypothetical protein
VNHATKLDSLRHRVSLAFLFLLEIWSQLVGALYPGHLLTWTSWLSWGLYVDCLGTLAWVSQEEDEKLAPSEVAGAVPHQE